MVKLVMMVDHLGQVSYDGRLSWSLAMMVDPHGQVSYNGRPSW